VPANANLFLRESGGAPFQVNLTGQGTGSSFNFRLETNGSAIFQTDGSSPLAVGAAILTSDVPIGASGIFSVFDAKGRFQTEAGVGAGMAVYGVTLPVDITGKCDTGVAIFNPSGLTAELTLRLLTEDGEAKGGSRKISLAGTNHMVKFVSELFPGTTGFRGSLAVNDAGIVALSLRQNSTPLAYTSLPVKQGISMGRIQPLLNQTKTGITAAGDVKVDATLATGFKLAGKINGPGYLGVVGAQSSMGEIFVGRISHSAPTPTYLLVLPAGTYNLKVCYEAQDGYADITYTDPNPVQVSSDTTRDITLPPVSLNSISGRVSGLSTLPQIQFKSIVLNSIDNTVWVQTRLEDDGTYRGMIPPGRFRANPYLPDAQLPDGGTQHLTIFNLGAVNIGSSPVIADFAVPPLARLSGTVSGAGSVGVSTRATDRSAPAVAMDSCGYFPAYNSTNVDTAGRHQMLLVKDRSYDVEAQLPVIRDNLRYAGI
jgi:hypothetical protein